MRTYWCQRCINFELTRSNASVHLALASRASAAPDFSDQSSRSIPSSKNDPPNIGKMNGLFSGGFVETHYRYVVTIGVTTLYLHLGTAVQKRYAAMDSVRHFDRCAED